MIMLVRWLCVLSGFVGIWAVLFHEFYLEAMSLYNEG